MQQIFAVHLLNDYSGSPMVFKQALQTLQENGHRVHLFTATAATGGCLSQLPNVTLHNLPYKRFNNRLLTLLSYLFVQVYLFFVLLARLQKTDMVYVNTLLPAGAALAGRLRGCNVVYHIHEVSISPAALKRLLTAVAEFTADRVIFVSDYVRRSYAFVRPLTCVVYNALSPDFEQTARQSNVLNFTHPFTVLMLCSLKAYKGVYEFVECARQLPHIRFMLVLNAGAADAEAFKHNSQAPPNCHIYPVQTNTHVFYKQAHVVVNFSRQQEWVETFGLTILEGMAYGLPAIVPPVGGVCELVKPGENGYCLNSADTNAVTDALKELSGNLQWYLTMSGKSRLMSRNFGIHTFGRQLTGVFESLKSRANQIPPVE